MDILLQVPETALQDVLRFQRNLSSNPENKIEYGSEGELRKSAVLIPLIWEKNQWEILFTRRSNHVQDHKGQVSFPGGMTEEEDATIVSTALREAKEEINLDISDVHVIGFLPDYETNSRFKITPVVAVIRYSSKIRPCTNEVTHIFTIPVIFLADEKNYTTKMWNRSDGKNVPVLYYSEYEGELLWGITARITNDLLTRIKK